MTVLGPGESPLDGKQVVRTFTDKYGQECREYDDGTIVTRIDPAKMKEQLQDMAREMEEKMDQVLKDMERLETMVKSDSFKHLMQRKSEILKPK